MGNAELDKHILACCSPRWRKVARVLTDALEVTGLEGKGWSDRALTKRLRVLVRKHQLEAAGNIYNWRASEVRLPTAKEA